MKKILLSIILCLLTVQLFAPFGLVAVEAQERKFNGIIINPAIVNIELAPGQSYEGEISLVNDFQSEDRFQFTPYITNFTQSGETGDPKFYYDENESISTNAAEWVTVLEPNYTIGFTEEAKSKFRVEVPLNADPGGHYAAILYLRQEQSDVDPSQVGLNTAIGSLLFITVVGDVERDGELVEFKSTKNVYDVAPFEFSIRYKNTGNVHSPIGGNIFIYKSDITNPVGIIEVNEDAGVTLPGYVRQYFEVFGGGFITRENGTYQIHPKEITKVYFGKYKATLKLKHDKAGERVTTERTISFLVIPWQLLVVLSLVVLIFVLVVFFKLGRSKK